MEQQAFSRDSEMLATGSQAGCIKNLMNNGLSYMYDMKANAVIVNIKYKYIIQSYKDNGFIPYSYQKPLGVTSERDGLGFDLGFQSKYCDTIKHMSL